MTEEEEKAISELKSLYVNSENITLEQKFALETTLNLIKKLQKEIEKKDKIIDEMAEAINNYDIDEDICRQMGNRIHCNEFADKEKCKACIIKNYEKKVEGNK